MLSHVLEDNLNKLLSWLHLNCYNTLQQVWLFTYIIYSIARQINITAVEPHLWWPVTTMRLYRYYMITRATCKTQYGWREAQENVIQLKEMTKLTVLIGQGPEFGEQTCPLQTGSVCGSNIQGCWSLWNSVVDCRYWGWDGRRSWGCFQMCKSYIFISI